MVEREYHLWDKKGGSEDEDWIKFYKYAEAYRKKFLTLLSEEKSKEDSVTHPEDILPVLMIFFQYLELIFKSLLIKKRTSIEEIKGHNPYQVYKKVKTKYPDFELSPNVILFIEDLEKMSNFGESLRYPINVKGKRFWSEDNGGILLLGGIEKITKQTLGEIYNYLKTKVF